MPDDWFPHVAYYGATVILLIGVIIYGFLLIYAYVTAEWEGWVKSKNLYDSFNSNPYAAIGLPVTALSTFCIVATFFRLFPPVDAKGDQILSLKLFNLEFSGPSGPITLWIVTYLAVVASIRIIRSES